MFKIKINLCLFILFISYILNGQTEKISDSLINASYEYLTENYLSNYPDSLKAVKYANVYFKKAQISRDSVEMANGYYLRKILDSKNNVRYDLYDSIINISKNFKNSRFPSIAYFNKGSYLFIENKYGLALENYIQASNYNNGDNKDELSFLIDYNISIIKLRIGEHKEALNAIKKAWKYSTKNNYLEKAPDRYFNTVFYLSDAYRKNELLDSAMTYAKLGAINAKRINSDSDYYDFLMLEGILNIDNDVDIAISQLNYVLPYLITNGEKVNVAISYQYLGKAYLKKNESGIAIKNFLKVDSIMNGKDLIFIELLDSYRYLRNHYKKSKDFKLELNYINKILKHDSIFNSKYRNINSIINDEYDTPNLLKHQKEIINHLKNTNEQKSNLFYFSLIFIVMILLVLIYQLSQKRKFTKRFNELVANTSNDNNLINQSAESENEGDIISLDISQEIIDKILEGLNNFEKNLGYLNSSINSSEFSKSIGTNNSYFTKVFKYYKGVNFSLYLKEMRLKYAFERLQKDSLFRKYSIKAISKDCGFTSSESFSKSFYKKYGVYPSFFIKKLKLHK